MWQRLLDFCKNGRVMIIAFVATNFITFGVFKSLPHLDGLLIDLQFSYDKAEVLAILTSIGEAGRTSYVWGNLIDNVYPFAYGIFFIGFLYRFFPANKGALLALVPLALAIVDIFETAQIGVMVRNFPDIGETQAMVSSLFTSTKTVLKYASLLLVLVAGINAVHLKIRG